MKRHYITDSAWGKILAFCRKTKGIYTENESKLVKFFEGIFYMMRTGNQWRELHERYGKWNSVFKRFNNWAKKGVWHKMLDFCAKDADLEYIMSDATVMRAHACAAGYKEQSTQGLGRSRGGFSSKLHVKVDALGNLLKIIVTPGQASEAKYAKDLIGSEDLCGAYAIGDKGYDSDEIRAHIEAQNGIPVIPPRSNRKKLIEYDKFIYRERHAVECFFSKLKYFRRLCTRFDKSVRNFAAFVYFAGVILWLR